MMVPVPSGVRLPLSHAESQIYPVPHTRLRVAVPPPLPALSLAIMKHVKKYILFRNVWGPFVSLGSFTHSIVSSGKPAALSRMCVQWEGAECQSSQF